MWPALFGWPAFLLVFALSIAGILRSKPVWLVAAAIVVAPIFLYLAATPRISWVVLLIPVLLAGSGFAIRRSYLWVAWILLIPYTGFVGWLAIIILQD